MAKINQEEYGVLKGLDVRWKWIARDDENQTYSAEVYVFERKPEQEDGYWNNIGNGEYAFLRGRDASFQFIQWEDDEPYNIAELIEEYESEETEVKKDKKWAQKEVDRYLSYEGVNEARNALVFAKGVIDQLDEPEVLSQEWVAEHEMPISWMAKEQKVVRAEDLRNLLVPTLSEIETVELSQKTADELNRYKELGYSLKDLLVIAGSKQAQEKLARAWLDGFTVEEEQKYRVLDGNATLLGRINGLMLTTVEILEYYPEYAPTFELTEQEIKDYDERYWAFAEPVEELEE